MFYPEVPDNANTRQSISQWLGYNHNLRIGDGEFYDCENLSSDNYPLISPRKKRPVLASLPDAVRGLLYTDGDLAYLSGGTLYLGSASYDLSSYMTDLESEQQMIKFGSYLLIFPLGLYFNTADRTDYGSLGSAYTAPEGVTVAVRVAVLPASRDSVLRFRETFRSPLLSFRVMDWRRLGSAMRETMAATPERLMVASGVKVPFASLPVRTPARYRR